MTTGPVTLDEAVHADLTISSLINAQDLPDVTERMSAARQRFTGELAPIPSAFEMVERIKLGRESLVRLLNRFTAVGDYADGVRSGYEYGLGVLNGLLGLKANDRSLP